MKRNCLLLILMILSFFIIRTVHAEEIIFEKAWVSEVREQQNPMAIGSSKNYKFSDGYLFVDSDYLWYYGYTGDLTLSYYSKDGKKIVEKTLDNAARYAVDEKNIYMLSVEEVLNIETGVEEDKYYINIFDDTLEIKDKVEISRDIFSNAYTYYSFRGMDTYTKENGNIIFLTYNSLITLDVANKRVSKSELTDDALKKYFPLIYMSEQEEISEMYLFKSFATVGKTLVKSGHYYLEEKDETTKTDERDTYALFEIYNDNKLVKEVKNDEYESFNDVKIINNHIIVTAIYSIGDNVDSSRSDILVYSLDGELKQKLTTSSVYVAVEENQNGFMVTAFNLEESCEYRNRSSREFWYEDSCKTELYHELYNFVENEVPEENDNPETTAVSILGLFIIAGLAIYAIKLGRNKADFIS